MLKLVLFILDTKLIKLFPIDQVALLWIKRLQLSNIKHAPLRLRHFIVFRTQLVLFKDQIKKAWLFFNFGEQSVSNWWHVDRHIFDPLPLSPIFISLYLFISVSLFHGNFCTIFSLFLPLSLCPTNSITYSQMLVSYSNYLSYKTSIALSYKKLNRCIISPGRPC